MTCKTVDELREMFTLSPSDFIGHTTNAERESYEYHDGAVQIVEAYRRSEGKRCLKL